MRPWAGLIEDSAPYSTPADLYSRTGGTLVATPRFAGERVVAPQTGGASNVSTESDGETAYLASAPVAGTRSQSAAHRFFPVSIAEACRSGGRRTVRVQ